jgi:hypothetical protein
MAQSNPFPAGVEYVYQNLPDPVENHDRRLGMGTVINFALAS